MKLRLIMSGLVAMLTIYAFQASAEQSDAPQVEEYKEGVHYVALEFPIKTRDASRVEVAEYFSYGCPHCYQFEPRISAWHHKLPEDVQFIRTPATWHKVYTQYAQTYYTAIELKVLDKVHAPLFMAIQQQGRALDTQKSMAEFFAEQGIAKADFNKAYKSFGVNSQVRLADSLGRAYRASGVPAIIVNGKYRIEGSMAGSTANMLKIASYLVEKERQHLQAP